MRSPSGSLPITRDLTLAYALSLVVAVLMAVVSVAGLVLGSAGLYGADPKLAVGVTEAEAGLKKDLYAVRAGLVEPWSNGLVEGFFHKLKLLKCQKATAGRASSC
jgi:hypothetical protein